MGSLGRALFRTKSPVRLSFQIADIAVRYRVHEVEFPRGECPHCRASIDEVGFIEWSLSESGISSSVRTNLRGEKEVVVDGAEEFLRESDPEVHTVRVSCGRCREVLAEGQLSIEGFQRGNIVELSDKSAGRNVSSSQSDG